MPKINFSEDVVPINGSKTFSFTLSALIKISHPEWIEIINQYQWKQGLSEIGRHWDYIEKKRIWSPWPAISYCIGDVEIPIPEDKMSPTEKMVHEILMQGRPLDLAKAVVRFFLFPVEKPKSQSESVAQLICESPIGSEHWGLRMWVDALRPEELSDENIIDIQRVKERINR